MQHANLKLIAARPDRGFTEVEFSILVALGLFIAGVLAHFIFEQSAQLHKFKALVQRDAVRLSIETQLADQTILQKSAAALPKGPVFENLRACLLGCDSDDGTGVPRKGGACCQAREKSPITLLELGDERRVLAGRSEEPSCLDADGKARKPEAAAGADDCFASAQATIEPICAGNQETCDKASAAILNYHIEFLSPYFQGSPELMSVERTVSVIFDK